MLLRRHHLLSLGLLAAANLYLFIAGLPVNWRYNDLLAYYVAGRLVLTGQVAHLYDVPLYRAMQTPLAGPMTVYPVLPLLHAPAYALPFVPLAALPFDAARGVWMAVGVALLGVSLRVVNRWLAVPYRVSLWLVLSCVPVGMALLAGQTSLVTLLLLVAIAGLEWRGEHGMRPGVIAGLLLYKPQLLIPLIIVWLATRRWRTLAGFCGVGAAIGLVSVAVSLQAAVDYLVRGPGIAAMAQTWVNYWRVNASIHALAGAPVAVGVALAVLALLALAWRNGPNRYGHAMLWVAPLLASPYLVRYDALIILVPVFLLLPLCLQDRVVRVALIVIWLAQAALWFWPWLLPLAALGLFVVLVPSAVGAHFGQRLIPWVHRQPSQAGNELP